MFDELFPHYMLMGMTYEQFWEQDVMLARYYRKAYQLRQEEQNRLAWLQGMYFYEALCDVSPILHAFAKSGTRTRPFPDKPYEFSVPKKMTKKERNEQKKQAAVDYMERMTARFNQSFAKRLSDKKQAELEKVWAKPDAVTGTPDTKPAETAPESKETDTVTGK